MSRLKSRMTWLVVLLGFAGILHGQQPEVPYAPFDPPAYHEKLIQYLEELRAKQNSFRQDWPMGEHLFDELKPSLEQVTGEPADYCRWFCWTTITGLEVAEDKVLSAHANWLYPEHTAQQEWLFRTTRAELQRLLLLIRVHCSMRFDVEYVPEVATWWAARVPGAEKAESIRFTRLALAHAAVFVHLDHRYGLRHRLLMAKSREEFEVLFALGHGAALWQTAEVARLLGAADLVPLLMIDYVRHVPESASARDSAARQVLQRQHELALRGYRYFQEQARSQPMRLDEVLAAHGLEPARE
ncbi:MAG: hypothetical protein AB7K24_07965 [Gemmataceae bacterium]